MHPLIRELLLSESPAGLEIIPEDDCGEGLKLPMYVLLTSTDS
jgi:hypothetical protein